MMVMAWTKLWSVVWLSGVRHMGRAFQTRHGNEAVRKIMSLQ